MVCPNCQYDYEPADISDIGICYVCDHLCDEECNEPCDVTEEA